MQLLQITAVLLHCREVIVEVAEHFTLLVQMDIGGLLPKEKPQMA
jgi:hypothetical protein